MTRPHAIRSSALAATAINVLAALAFIAALTPEAAQPENHSGSTPLYQLSPIPAGADWGRS